jgi:osmotically-inducible protein OsmY
MNRGKNLTAMLALITATALAACGRNGDQGPLAQSQASSVAPGAGSPSAANAKLVKAVKAMLDRDEQLRTANLSVNADVTKNEVTLSGTVESEAMRAKAVELAKTAHVGVIVNDKLIVKPRRSNMVPQKTVQV